MSLVNKLQRSIHKSLTRPAANPFDARLPGFDEIYYRYWYRDIPGSMDAARHYLTIGWKEGRDPSAGFSTRGYLSANPDVAQSRANPLIHFLNYGLAEGRQGWAKEPGHPAPAPSAPIDFAMKLLAPPVAPEPPTALEQDRG